MSIFKRSVASLQKKSAEAFNVFKRTVDELTTINNQIDGEKAKRLDKIKSAQQEHDDLHSQQTANNKLITKITEFLQ